MSEPLSVVLTALLLLSLNHDQTVSTQPGGSFKTYTHKGKKFKLYLPENYHFLKSYPLMVMLHGCTQNADDFAIGTEMNSLADEKGFIVVYPQQSSNANLKKCWNWFEPLHQLRGFGEPAIIAGIVKKVKKMHFIQEDKVFIAGLSAGGAMSIVMGVTYPELFSGIGVAAGLEYQAALNVFNAYAAMANQGPSPVKQGRIAYQQMGRRAKPLPVIVFHGNADSTVNLANADQVVQQWITTNNLAYNGKVDGWINDKPKKITEEKRRFGRDYTSYRFESETGELAIDKYVIKGMGHAWSGGNLKGSYTDPKGPNSSRIMWDFFIEQASSAN
ncbi:PHB depolymerase family esterase [Priestia megaterium]|nr:PHB depolymerase family esterase [Priestia megaterium]